MKSIAAGGKAGSLQREAKVDNTSQPREITAQACIWRPTQVGILTFMSKLGLVAVISEENLATPNRWSI
jgi:hypothetical protein